MLLLGSVDEWMDEWMGGWMNGWVDGWMEWMTHAKIPGKNNEWYANAKMRTHEDNPKNPSF